MFIVWVGVIVATLWIYFNKLYSRFSDNGVKHFKVFPPLGNMLPIMIKKEHIAYHLHKMYTTFANERFIGRYEFVNPSVIIRDLELVKKITIKDFEHFIDHRDFTDETIDPLFGRNLFSLTGLLFLYQTIHLLFLSDPEKFNPDRFSEENKHLINPFTYLPFGVGPRNCIGSRFALLEVKILLYYSIKNMKVSPSEKTIHPTKLSAETFNPKLDEGHWLRFTSRK